MSLQGRFILVTATIGGRDHIYVGHAERQGDRLVLKNASNVVFYNDVGTAGITTQPEKATCLRPVTTPEGEVNLPIESCVFAPADENAWAEYMGRSIG